MTFSVLLLWLCLLLVHVELGFICLFHSLFMDSCSISSYPGHYCVLTIHIVLPCVSLLSLVSWNRAISLFLLLDDVRYVKAIDSGHEIKLAWENVQKLMITLFILVELPILCYLCKLCLPSMINFRVHLSHLCPTILNSMCVPSYIDRFKMNGPCGTW